MRPLRLLNNRVDRKINMRSKVVYPGLYTVNSHVQMAESIAMEKTYGVFEIG